MAINPAFREAGFIASLILSLLTNINYILIYTYYMCILSTEPMINSDLLAPSLKEERCLTKTSPRSPSPRHRRFPALPSSTSCWTTSSTSRVNVPARGTPTTSEVTGPLEHTRFRSPAPSHLTHMKSCQLTSIIARLVLICRK